MAAIDTTSFDKYTKIWSGPKSMQFFNADCSIGKILYAFMRNNPQTLCQISDSEGTALTNGEAITFAIRIAQFLKRQGLKQHDVVGIVGGNTTYLTSLVLGCLLNCTPFHAVNPAHDEATIKQLFTITRPKIIFCDGEIYENISIISKILRSNVFTMRNHRKDRARIEDLLEPTKEEIYYVPQELNLGGDQTVAILCTSGTMGLPKPVCISNSSCHFEFGFLTSQDVLLSLSSLDWATGFFNMIFACGHGATRIITDKTLTAEYILEIVDKYNVTILTANPFIVRQLVDCSELSQAKLSSLRFLSIGGGNCYPTTLMKISEYLSNGFISFGYAMTECGGIAANMGIQKPNSVGKLIPGVRVKILDEAGRSMGHGERGEILVHNNKTWNGYYGNPKETKRMQDYQGWYHTGDIGYFDSENYLHVVDRKKDCLKFHGMRYWPHEIEEVVSQLPDVLEVCVFGVFNEVDGEPAAAAVVKRSGSKLSEQTVVEHVAQRLVVNYKQLHCGVFFVDSLPKTGSGKVIRHKACELALGMKWPPVTMNNSNGYY